MRRKQLKRVIFSCTVFVILFNLFSSFSYAVTGSLSGTAYSSNYMPVCNEYPTIATCPYGENTHVFYYRAGTTEKWYFYTSVLDVQNYTYHYTQGDTYNSTSSQEIFTFYMQPSQTYTNYRQLYITSGSPIICLSHTYGSSTFTSLKLGSYQNGSYSDSYITYDTQGYYYLSTTLSVPSGADVITWVSSVPYTIDGLSCDLFCDRFPNSYSVNDFSVPYYLASYCDSVSAGVETIIDEFGIQSAQLTNYYNSLNNTLHTLEQNYNDLYDLVSVYGDIITEQNDMNSEQIIESESNINSHVDEQVSQAVDDINNAGEDISDIDNDIDDVNDIVDTLNEWVSSLDTFADRIDNAEDGVEDALEHGKTLMNGFLGVCPPIVIALFTFALVFLVVRKIIGR